MRYIISSIKGALSIRKSDRAPAPEGYVYADEAAKAIGITPAGIRARCAKGKIIGAKKIARDWLIPTGKIPAAHRGSKYIIRGRVDI